jgi:ubiquinone/menaquinone biosynthesis C-methylase UbiE
MPTFDERAADWDTPDKVDRAEVLADAIVQRLAIPPGARAIEIGAGTGLLGLAVAARLSALGKPLAELVLADPSQGMLDVAAAKLRDPRFAFARTTRFALTADPLPDGSPFDLALSLLVLHHVESTTAAFAALHDLVRGGGRLALADLDAEDGSFHDDGSEGIHHHGFDRHLVAAQADAAGFRDVEVATGTEIERDGRRYPVFLLTAVAS